jgi:large subunit ribosomal protein L3
MKVMLGRKIGMSQMFSPEGEAVAVTLISCPDNIITLRRNEKRDGYEAVQLSLPRKETEEEKGEEKLTPRERKRKYVRQREFALEVEEKVHRLSLGQFELGDIVEVSGISKGKGFQGVVKRHKFKGGPASHGHTDWERKAGSIGSRFPQHVRKGKRMPGRMGADRVTVKNLVVMWINAERKLLALKGAVPGAHGSILEIKTISGE